MDAHLLLKHVITAVSPSRSPKHIATMAPTRRQRRVALVGVCGSGCVVLAPDVAWQGAASSSRDAYPGRLFLARRLSCPPLPRAAPIPAKFPVAPAFLRPLSVPHPHRRRRQRKGERARGPERGKYRSRKTRGKALFFSLALVPVRKKKRRDDGIAREGRWDRARAVKIWKVKIWN